MTGIHQVENFVEIFEEECHGLVPGFVGKG